MQNAIELIEARKIKKKWSTERLSRESGVSSTMYTRYLNNESEPSYKNVNLLLGAVGLKFVAVYDNMDGAIKIQKWAIVHMFIRLNKQMVFDRFREVTGIEAHHYFDILRVSLFSVWFYRTHKRWPLEALLDEEFAELQTWGLMTNNKPSETAYGFYNLMEKDLEYYLNTANVIHEMEWLKR